METIKAVKMVRQIRDVEYSITKNMTNKDFISYVRKKAKSVNDEALKLIKANNTAQDYSV